MTTRTRPRIGFRRCYCRKLAVVLTMAGIAGICVSTAQAQADRAAQPLADVPAAQLELSPPLLSDAAESEWRAQYDAAQEYLADGDAGGALAAIDAGLQIATAPELLHLLAEVRRRQRRFGEARLALERAIAADPHSTAGYYLLGRLYREQGREADAIAWLRRATILGAATSDDARATAAWYALGETLDEAGYALAATEAYAEFDRSVWQDHPAHRDATEVAAILAQNPNGALERRLALLADLGRTDERVRVARWAAETIPSDVQIGRIYVRTLLDSGDPAEAFAYCRERLDHEFQSADDNGGVAPPALLGVAVEAGQAAGELAEWVTDLTNAVGADRAVRLAEHVARRLDDLNERELAARLWGAVAEARPKSADAAWALAAARRASGDLEAALNSLIVFVRHNANEAAIPPTRLRDWTVTSEATNEFLGLVERFTAAPDCDFATYAVLGAMAAAAGQDALSERLFDDALRDRPGSTLAHLARGRILLERYRWEEARGHAEAALEVSEQIAAGHALFGAACAGLDENGAAEAAFKQALEYAPQSLDTILRLARLYRRTGNLLGAQRYFQRAWTLDQSNAEAIEELVDSYLEGGKVTIAMGLLEDAQSASLPDDALRRIRTTLKHAARPLRDEHLTELKEQLAAHPDDLRTGLKLAAGYLLHQRDAEALTILDDLRQLAPDDDRVLHLLAHAHMRHYELDEAIETLRDLTQRYPRRREALQRLADALLADFQVEEARAIFVRILDTGMDAAELDQARAQLLATYVDFREPENALGLLDEWIASDPDSVLWPRAKMRVLLAAERPDDALEYAEQRLNEVEQRYDEQAADLAHLQESVTEEDYDAELRARASRAEELLAERAAERLQRREAYIGVCLQIPRLVGAERRVRQWRSEAPDQPQISEWLIEILLAAERGEEALELVGEYRLQEPRDLLRVFDWRARCYVQMGQVERAANELASLLEERFIRESAVERAQLRQRLLTILVEGEEQARAVALCDAWLVGVDPQDRLAMYELLVLKRFALQAAGRDEDVERVTEQLLELDPLEPGLNNDLAYTWADTNRNLDRALKMSVRAVAAEPLNPAYLDTLGWVYYKLGDFPRARIYLERATRLVTGQDAVIYDHLGDAALRLGDLSAARAAWLRSRTLIEDLDVADRLARDTELLAALRTKLTALDSGEMPNVAPTGFEQAPPEPEPEEIS